MAVVAISLETEVKIFANRSIITSTEMLEYNDHMTVIFVSKI